jgi:hypothetical protein
LAGGQLDRLVGAEAIELASVDLVLLEPGIDRRFADREGRGQLLYAVPARASSKT